MHQRDRQEREPFLTISPVVLVFIVICTLVHFARVYLLSEEGDYMLIVHAAFIPLRYSGEFAPDPGMFLSPMTYSFLHGDFVHLAINMIWLAAFGSPLAHRIGAPRFIAFWLLTALGAALAHFLVHPFEAVPVIGASGAVSGMMAAAARFGFSVDRHAQPPAFTGPRLGLRQLLQRRNTVVFLVVWLVVNLIAGLGWLTPEGSAAIAWEAHIGGFVAGLVGIVFLDRPQRG